MVVFNFAPEFPDLVGKHFVFTFFLAQKPESKGSFFFYAGGSQFVGVAAFVVAAVEIFNLDQAFFDQCFEAVIDFPEAAAELFGEPALWHRRGLGDGSDQVVTYFFGHIFFTGHFDQRALAQ